MEVLLGHYSEWVEIEKKCSFERYFERGEIRKRRIL